MFDNVFEGRAPKLGVNLHPRNDKPLVAQYNFRAVPKFRGESSPPKHRGALGRQDVCKKSVCMCLHGYRSISLCSLLEYLDIPPALIVRYRVLRSRHEAQRQAAHPREFSVSLFLASDSSLTKSIFWERRAIGRQLTDNEQTINRKLTEN